MLSTRDDLRDGFVVAGTDTGVGKTVLSALLTLALDGEYWKPVQSGLEDETDSEAVLRMTAVAGDRIHDEAYRLKRPLSPDQSARAEGVAINRARIVAPTTARPLVIELAGGLLVPYSDDVLQIDLIAAFERPLVLAARSGLGTLNHTLLSIEALARRGIATAGIVMMGDEHRGNRESLERWSAVPVVGSVPTLTVIDAAALLNVYANHFTPIEQWTIHA